MRPYKPYISQTISELWDKLGSMMLNSPTFIDDTGLYPEKGIDSEFHALNESLKLLRPQFGEENYARMVELSERMRAHFEADPEDKTDETLHQGPRLHLCDGGHHPFTAPQARA